MEIQYAQDGCTIDLGHRGETGVTQVIFDVSPWVKEFGAGAAVVLARRSVDRTPYPVAIEQDGGMVTWTVGAADTAYTGSGKVELYYYVQEQLVKTAVYKTSVSPDIGAQDADVPDQYQGWVDKITRVGTQAGIDAQSAAASAQAAADSAEGAAGSAAGAGERAGAAEQSAQKAETAAQTATEQAGKAQTSEESAQRSATEASQSATTATDKAAEAAQSAETAQQAQEAAEDAQGKAEEAARQAAQSAETAGEAVLGAYVCKTAEGTVVSFDDGADGLPLKSCVVQIEPVQEGSGDPSPDNVRPIKGWTGCEVQRRGKNLNPNEGVNYSTSTSERFFLKAGQYVFSTDNGAVVGQNNAIYIQLQDEAGNVITKGGITSSWFFLNGDETFYYGGANAPSRAFTLNYDAYMLLGFNNQKPTNFNALQLEVGTTATDYEPYTGATYHITFPSEAGTVYGGELDLTEGLLTSTLDADGNPLEEPLVYQLEPLEITTLLGANTIWADCGPLSVTYRADPTILYNKLTNAIISLGGNV